MKQVGKHLLVVARTPQPAISLRKPLELLLLGVSTGQGVNARASMLLVHEPEFFLEPGLNGSGFGCTVLLPPEKPAKTDQRKNHKTMEKRT